MTYKNFIENAQLENYYYADVNTNGDVYIYFKDGSLFSIIAEYEYENRELMSNDIAELIDFACDTIVSLNFQD